MTSKYANEEHARAVAQLMEDVQEATSRYMMTAVVNDARDAYGVSVETESSLYWDLIQALGAERMRNTTQEKTS